MGSPVFIVVANLVMKETEQTALSTFHSTPLFWKRYVDDMCTALPKGSIPAFHQHLNGVNEHLQFILEEEENGNLALLDLLLNRDHAGSVDTTVHRK